MAAGESSLGALVEQCWAGNVGNAAMEYSVHVLTIGLLFTTIFIIRKDDESWAIVLAVRV